jgi:hypothetical protein
MFKTMIAAALVTVSFLGTIEANAKQEVQVARTIWELSDFPELSTKAKAVCASKAVLSVKLQTACKDDKFPSVTKAGAFRNVGIGAELNALIRQTQPEVATEKKD